MQVGLFQVSCIPIQIADKPCSGTSSKAKNQFPYDCGIQNAHVKEQGFVQLARATLPVLVDKVEVSVEPDIHLIHKIVAWVHGRTGRHNQITILYRIYAYYLSKITNLISPLCKLKAWIIPVRYWFIHTGKHKRTLKPCCEMLVHAVQYANIKSPVALSLMAANWVPSAELIYSWINSTGFAKTCQLNLLWKMRNITYSHISWSGSPLR